MSQVQALAPTVTDTAEAISAPVELEEAQLSLVAGGFGFGGGMAVSQSLLGPTQGW